MPSEEAGDEDSGIDVGAAKLPQDGKTLFQQIVLLFCPTAAVAGAGEESGRTEGSYVKFKTR